MNNKFKFGDRVKDDFLGECIVLSCSEHFVHIQNEKGEFDAIANPKNLTLIPQPDTVRLDFIIMQVSKNNTVNFYQYEYDYGDKIQFCEISFCEDRGYDEVAFHSNSVRDVIDFAIESELKNMLSNDEEYFFKYIHNTNKEVKK